jgi:hypothetical protein
MPTLPPPVVSGQVIAASYLNSIRNSLGAFLNVTVGLTLVTDELDAGWSYIRSGSSAGSTKCLIGCGSLGTYVQSMELGMSFTSKPLNLQPNGGTVIIGGGVKRTATPSYANNAAAILGGLSVGMEYRATGADAAYPQGIKMEVY